MNLSVRKPSSRMGFGKSFKFLGLPVRGKPVQSLEEEKDEDIMDSFKPIEHTTCITTENSAQNSNCPDKTATTAGQGETPNSKTEDIKQELFGSSTLSGVVENETLPENPGNLNIQLNNTNSNSLWARKPCPDILMKDNHDIHEKLKATDTNSNTSCNKPAFGLFENMEVSIERQAPKVPSTPLPEKNWMSNPVSIADVHLKKNDEDNSLNSQAILKQKQTSYGGQMAANHFEIEKPVNPVCPVGVVTSASVVSSQEPNAIKNPYPLGAPHHPPKNVPSFPNNYYQPPQGKTDYPNILVNGKSYLKLGTIGRGGSSKVRRIFYITMKTIEFLCKKTLSLMFLADSNFFFTPFTFCSNDHWTNCYGHDLTKSFEFASNSLYERFENNEMVLKKCTCPAHKCCNFSDHFCSLYYCTIALIIRLRAL